MSRQINLYPSATPRKSKAFSAAWTVTAVVVIAVAMSAFHAWETRQLPDLRARRSEAGTQLKQVREQLAALGQTAQKIRSKALEDEVARSEILFKGRQEFFARLQSGEFGNREGYAKFLAALARQRLEGVWLTRIEISGAGSDFTIEGRAMQADLLPGFIKMLRNEEALRGRPIGALALREREIDPGGEPKAQAEPGASAQVGPASQRGSAAPPRVRVVEFTIGTGGTGATGGAGR